LPTSSDVWNAYGDAASLEIPALEGTVVEIECQMI
jgi:hypothetical protein